MSKRKIIVGRFYWVRGNTMHHNWEIGEAVFSDLEPKYQCCIQLSHGSYYIDSFFDIRGPVSIKYPEKYRSCIK